MDKLINNALITGFGAAYRILFRIREGEKTSLE
jgi:hypothetical protein